MTTTARQCATCQRSVTRIVKGMCQPCYKKDLRLAHQAAALGLTMAPAPKAAKAPKQTKAMYSFAEGDRLIEQRRAAEARAIGTYTFESWAYDSKTGRDYPVTVTGPVLNERHCQQCGSTDYEDVNTGSDPDLQGYSACCNEIVMGAGDCVHGSCYHS